MKLSTIWLFLASLLFSIDAHAEKEITVRYVGNMGVLISGENTSILVDGLHDEYNKKYYLYPTEKQVEELIENAGAEFPKIKAALNTHFHDDHFDAALSNAFLAKNELSMFMGSAQATSRLNAPNNQIISFASAGYQKQTIRYDSFSITGFYLDHVNPKRHGEVKNVGYIIEIDGVKVFHAGDSNWFDAVFESLSLNKHQIDIAILPFWMLLDKSSVPKMKKWLAPKQIVAMHMFPKDYEEYLKNILANYPNAEVFVKHDQSFTFQKN